MNSLALTSVKSVTDVSGMTPEQVQAWIQYMGNEYHHLIKPDQMIDSDIEDIPCGGEIIIRTWRWTDSNGSIHTLLDMDGHTKFLDLGGENECYDSFVLFDGQLLCDNQNSFSSKLYWQENPFPGFDLDLFNSIRKYLVDASRDKLKGWMIFDAAFNFLKAHPEFIEMEKEARFN